MFQERMRRIKMFNYSNNDTDFYKHTVATVWNVSFERMRDLNPAAVRILEACTFLEPENTPTCLFKRQYSVLKLLSTSSDKPESELNDKEDIGKAITVLVEFSFVKRTYYEVEDDDEDPASDLLTIHRLVQKVIYDRMNIEHKLHWVHNIAAALNKEVDFDDSYAPKAKRIMDTSFPHTSLLGDL